MTTMLPEIAVLQEITYVVVHEKNVRHLLDEVIAILERRMGMLRGTIASRPLPGS